jgi:hypothetical protein
MFFKFVKSEESSTRVAPILESNKEVGSKNYFNMMMKGEELSDLSLKKQPSIALIQTKMQTKLLEPKELETGHIPKKCDVRDFKIILEPEEEKRRMKLLKYATKVHLFQFLFSEWGLNTSAHGITNVIRLDNRLLKVIWLLCFLASSVYCIYTIVGIMVSFLEFNVHINQQVNF